ncbi:MAG: M3 family metallopeptidase [Candidatus Hodarchaeales archaeon]
MEQIKIDAEKLEIDYKGKINISSMTPIKLNEVIKKVESIMEAFSPVYLYSLLSVSADQENKKAREVHNSVQMVYGAILKNFAFLSIDVGHLLRERRSEFLENPVLGENKHYLEKLLRRQPFLLSEKEEKLIIEKNQYGKNGWSQLQEQWLATRKFIVKIKGEEKTVSWSSGYKLFSDPERNVRKEAVKSMLGDLGKDVELYASILRNMSADHVMESKRRKYPSTMGSSLITNDITKEMLDNMFKVVESYVHVYQEFLLIKAEILGTNKLLGEDLYAPVPFEDTRKITWTDARQQIIEGYSSFNKEFGKIAKGMFDKNRIDSLPRSAKVSGAFNITDITNKSAFILQSFQGKMDDMLTLAHEMGHAIHSHLVSANQSYLNTLQPFTLTETASEFGTMLFTDKLIQEAPKEIKKALLFKVLENIMIGVFEVGSRMRFEQKLYSAIEKNEYLNPERISKLFWEARKIYFGDAVEWHPEQAFHWCWKSHYYRTDLRFYNYPYTFGQLLVLALYNQYHNEGESFIPKYKEFLAAGGSKSPEELGKVLGMDLTSPEFWETGFTEIKRLINELKTL